MRAVGYSLAAVLLCAWPRGAAAQLVEPPVGPAYQLTKNTPKPQALLPLSLKDKVTLKQVRVTHVIAGDLQQPALLNAFSPALVAAGLELAVDGDRVHAPLTYKVLLELSGELASQATPTSPTPAPTSATQSIELQLAMPAAKLAPVTAIVRRHARWPWSGGEDLSVEIPLRETGGVTSIAKLWFGQVDPSMNGDEQVEARFEPQTPPAPLGAGQRSSVQFKAKNLGIGTTKGNLTVAADELEAPLTVPFEIRTKIFDWLIIPWYLVFGVLGWFVRHLLQDAGARAALKVQAETLRKRLKDEAATLPDEELVTRLREAERSLEEPLRQKDNAELATALETARSLLEESHTARGNFVKELLAKIGKREQDLSRSFDLPVGLDLAAARSKLTEATTALQENRLKDAKIRWTEHDEAVLDICRKVDDWSQSLELGLAQFFADPTDDTTPIIPSSVRAEATELATQLKALLVRVKFKGTEPPALPNEYFLAVHEANTSARDFVELVTDAFTAEMRKAEQALRDAKKDPSAIEALTQAVTTLPDTNADVTHEQLDQLAAALVAGSQAVSSMLNAAEAKDMLKEGKYSQAIRKNESLKGAQLGALVADTQDAAALTQPTSKRSLAPQANATTTQVVVLPAPPAPRSQATIELKTIQATRSIVSAMILAVVSWVLYRETWVGTLRDFAAIAAFAFFTDFTLDAVLEAVGKFKTPAPP